VTRPSSVVGALSAAFLALLGGVLGCSEKAANIGNTTGDDPTVQAPVYARAAPPPGSDAGLRNASEPFRLVDGEGEILAFDVDAGQLFWITRTRGRSGRLTVQEATEGNLAMRTCASDGCAASVESCVQSDPHVAGISGWQISVNETHVFLGNTGAFPPDFAIAWRARNGCDAPAPLANGGPFAVDATRLFLQADGQILACETSDCAGTTSPLPIQTPRDLGGPAGASQLVLDGDYLYWEADNTNATGSFIYRIRKDGTAAPETVVSMQTTQGDFTVHDGNVFWLEHVDLGRIFSCPVTGCVDKPRVVADRLFAQHLAVSDGYVYFTEFRGAQAPSGASVARLSRCAIDGCTEPTVLSDGVALDGAFVMDGAFVYFVGSDCIDSSGQQSCFYIAAVPK
jgi:hypothetical protein